MQVSETAIAASTSNTDLNTGTANRSVAPEELAAYCSDPRLNQTFQLPIDLNKGRSEPFQVSYADIGFHSQNTPGSEEPEQVLLFFGPLLSSRFWNSAKHDLAQKYKIRLLTVERPGIGKTDKVPVDKLFEVWREVIPALLNHLSIKQVSVACHSGGTIFALDFIFHYPEFLNPAQPYIAMGGPWINSKRNGVRTMTIASSLPSSLIAQAGSASSFFNSTIAPLLGVSGIVSGSVMQLWPQAKLSGRGGADVALEEGVREGIMKYVFAESVTGVGQEAQLLLRKGMDETGWSDWDDVDVLAPRLAAAVREATGAKLRVDVFFAEKDSMIGDMGGKGPTWFESCWNGLGDIDFRSEVVMGTDHERVWDLRWDVMEKVFKTMTAKV